MEHHQQRGHQIAVNCMPPPTASCTGSNSSGGGGATKFGVRVGLGLLAMGDIALACGRSPAIPPSAGPPAVALPSSAAFYRGRDIGTASGRVAGRRPTCRDSGGGSVGATSTTRGGAGIGFVAPPVEGGGGGSSRSGSRRRNMMRRRSRASVSGVAPRPPPAASSRSTAAFALPPSTTMLSAPNNPQPRPNEQEEEEEEEEEVSPAGMSAGPQAGGVTIPAASNGAVNGAAGAAAAAGVSAGAVAAAAAAAAAPVRAAVPRTPEGVSSAVAVGGSRRLGVIRPAELGDMRAKRAKVKAMYARARGILRSATVSSLESAASILEEALILDPRDGHSWLLLARTRERMGDIDAATDVFKRAVKQCPNNVHLWQSWGMLQDKFGDPAMARISFGKGLKADPGNPFVCHAWGLMEQRDGDIDTARQIFESSDPSMQTSKALAELLALQGNVDEARIVLKEARDRLSAAASRGPANRPRWVGPGRRAKGSAMGRDEETDGMAELLLAWANVEESVGNEKRALELMDQASESEPENVMGRIGRARFEMRKGNVREARLILSDAASLPQTDGTLFSLWATLETREGNLDTALKIAEAATARFPRDKALLQTMGTAEEALEDSPVVDDGDGLADADGSIDDSSSSVVGVSEATPAEMSADMTAGSGVGYGETTDLRITGSGAGTLAPGEGPPSFLEARRLFELGILADPTHGPLYNAYGTMEARIGNVEHARDVYRRGIAARCSGAASVWQGFGALESSVGNREAAREIFSRGIRESPEEVSFLYHSLGSLELAAKRPAEAMEAFVGGIERYPKNTQLLLGAALSETRMNEPDKARDYFRRAVEADPTHAHAWQAWGLMETRSGNYDVARSLWERGLKASPMHGPLWQAYAVMEEKVGEPEKARKLFKAGLERCPDHVHLHQVLELGVRASPAHGPLYLSWAQMEHQMGNTAAARRRFEQGLEACPTYTRLYYAYADMEAAMGNTEFLVKLKDRGEIALMESWASPDELEEFKQRMETFESYARFDAHSSSEGMESSLDASSLGEFDFDW